MRLAAAALLTLASPSALAADARIVTHAYAGDEVVRVEGKAGVQATIAFGEAEHIENVAVGDAEAWQVTPNKRADLLFVKPLGESARTNMTVVTDQRTYFFDLVASSATKPIYMLRFSYGAPPGADGGPENAASRPVANAIDPALLNFAWKREGPARLLPAAVYDDGTSTYLVFSAGQKQPTITVPGDKTGEAPLPVSARGNAIVIAGMPRVISLMDAGNRGNRATLTDLRERGPAPVPTPEPVAAPTEPR